MHHRVTMQDIADALGISKVSVSKALNDLPGTSRALKSRILKKAFELGYQGTATRSVRTPPYHLCIVVSERFHFDNEQFYSKVNMHLMQACTRKNISLHLHVVRRDEGTARMLLATMRPNAYDGVFVSGEIGEENLQAVLKLSVPVIAVDFYREGFPMDSIIIDNFYAGFMAANYLLRCGHVQIGFLGDHRSTSSVSDRFFGYLKALTLAGLELNRKWHIKENYEGNIFTHRFTLPDPLPTSFVCHCDSAAYSLMFMLKGKGILVPARVSLIAFDNTDVSRSSDPKITTIDIDKRALAEKALEQMLWRLTNHSAPFQRIELNTRLIERQTVKTLPRK